MLPVVAKARIAHLARSEGKYREKWHIRQELNTKYLDFNYLTISK